MNRPDDDLDVAAWEVAPFQAQANERPPKYPEGAEGAALVAPNSASVNPLDLYVYLKARFGHANDLMMSVRNPGMEGISHPSHRSPR